MSHEPTPKGSLAAAVVEHTGASPMDCYQCGRCAAGCPQNVAGEMDLSPTRMMRLMQLEAAFMGEAQGEGFAVQALSADTPWLCAGCQACTTRCPQSLDIAGAMDVLRQEAMRRGAASTSRRARDIRKLHETLLKGATSRGRIHELALVMMYKLKTGYLLADATLGPKMIKRGKLHMLPGKGVDMTRVRDAAAELRKSMPECGSAAVDHKPAEGHE